eukprot:7951868-Pyramimonas_sp.AAC.1
MAVWNDGTLPILGLLMGAAVSLFCVDATDVVHSVCLGADAQLVQHVCCRTFTPANSRAKAPDRRHTRTLATFPA